MDIPLIPIEAYHKIEELRNQPNKEFTRMKKYLIHGHTQIPISIKIGDKVSYVPG